MARIAGVDLPPQKRLWVGLTSIYGIGQQRARTICAKAKVDETKKIKDLTEEEVNQIRQADRVRRARRGRSPQGGPDEHSPADRNSVLPRLAPPAQPAGARPAHPHQRPHPQGPAQGRGGRQEESTMARK